MDIPEDVMKAAIKCGETVCRNLDYDDVSVEVAVIARAILAERERCANAAHRHIGAKTTLDGNGAIKLTAKSIEFDIRNPEALSPSLKEQEEGN